MTDFLDPPPAGARQGTCHGQGASCLRGHLHLGGLPLQQGLVEQLVELVLVLGGVHHAIGQVLKPQPPARVGE